MAKWKHFIGVYLSDGSLHYVTKLGENHTAFWEEGKDAMEFKPAMALEICEGLNFNMIHAVVIKAPSFMNIRNDGEAKDESL